MDNWNYKELPAIIHLLSKDMAHNSVFVEESGSCRNVVCRVSLRYAGQVAQAFGRAAMW